MKGNGTQFFHKAEIAGYLLVVIVFPMLFIPFGLDYTDGPYHYMTFSGLRPASPTTFLFTCLGNLWVRLAGDTIMAMRLLTVILTILITIIPALIILKTQPWLQKLRVMAIATVFTTAMAYHLLNYDVFSNLILALLLSFVYLWLQQQTISLVLVLGLLTGIVAAIRIPSVILVLPITGLFIAIWINRHQTVAKTALHALLFLSVAAGVYALLFSTLGATIFTNQASSTQSPASSSMITGLSGNLSNPESSYSFTALITRYIKDGFRILEIVVLLAGLSIAWVFRRKLKLDPRWITGFLIFILFAYYLLRIAMSPYNYQLSFFYSAVAIGLLGLLSYHAFRQKNYNLLIFWIFVLVMGFIPAAGSNTGLLKTSGLYLAVLPVLLYFASNALAHDAMKGLKILIGASLIFSLANKILISNSYEDRPMLKLTATVDHPKLQGIRTTPLRKQQIEAIMRASDHLHTASDSKDVLYYGFRSWLFQYITDTPQPFRQRFNVDHKQTPHAEQLITYLKSKSNPPCVCLILDYPEVKRLTEGGETERLLMDYGYQIVETGNNFKFLCRNAEGENQ